VICAYASGSRKRPHPSSILTSCIFAGYGLERTHNQYAMPVCSQQRRLPLQCFLTGAHPKQITGARVTNGVSIDQLFAQHVAQNGATRVPSLQLYAENIGLSRSCAFEYAASIQRRSAGPRPGVPYP
jgi:hypothetical protein